MVVDFNCHIHWFYKVLLWHYRPFFRLICLHWLCWMRQYHNNWRSLQISGSWLTKKMPYWIYSKCVGLMTRIKFSVTPCQDIHYIAYRIISNWDRCVLQRRIDWTARVQLSAVPATHGKPHHMPGSYGRGHHQLGNR